MTTYLFASLAYLMLATQSLAAPAWNVGDCVLVDGPANLRAEPNGKIIRSLPTKSNVSIQKIEGKWVFINSFDFKSDVRCSDADDEKPVNGWIHESNLLPTTELALFEVAPCVQAFKVTGRGDVDPRIQRYEAKVKAKECQCADIYWEPSDRADCKIQKRTQGYSKDKCVKVRDFVVCEYSNPAGYGDGGGDIVCPLSCMEMKRN